MTISISPTTTVVVFMIPSAAAPLALSFGGVSACHPGLINLAILAMLEDGSCGNQTKETLGSGDMFALRFSPSRGEIPDI